VSSETAATSETWVSLADSYAACTRLARDHYENFPVASRLLPRRVRPHVAAIYAFARTADDVADEPGLAADERGRRLADWRRHLHEGGRSTDGPARVVFPALHDTIARFALPVSLFDDLLDAFEQDVTVARYERWEDVLDYCRRSAVPIGRLVLRLSGHRHDDLDRASDAVCTALQLTNFWQDLAVDWSRGRLYVPASEWRTAGATVEDLDARRWTPEWRAALAACGRRTRALFERGRPVCEGVTGRLRYELRATWLGGMRVLDRLERGGWDVFAGRPSLGVRDAVVIGWRALVWRTTPPAD
jgi:squalene synthase HpnC